MIKNGLVTVAFLSVILFTRGQGVQTTPLFDYLQETFDSSVIFYPQGSAIYGVAYFIITKKDTSHYLYTYKSPYTKAGLNPDPLKLFFVKQHIKFTQTIPDTNRFFLPQTTYHQDSILALKWRKIVVEDSVWQLPDDVALGDPKCRPGDVYYDIYDGTTDIFILITREDMKSLSFYAPGFYEECCSADIPGRKKEWDIRNHFREMFKNEFDY